MSLIVREAINDDYFQLSNLTMEVYVLHLKNRRDVYKEVRNPLPKEDFYRILSNSDTKLFVVESTDSKEVVAYSIVKIMTTQNISILITNKYAFIDDLCVKLSLEIWASVAYYLTIL